MRLFTKKTILVLTGSALTFGVVTSCGYFKKDKNDGDDEMKGENSLVFSDDQDMDGNYIFNEDTDSIAGWSERGADVEGDLAVTNEEMAAAATTLAGCFNIEADVISPDYTLAQKDADDVCSSGSSKLNRKYEDSFENVFDRNDMN